MNAVRETSAPEHPEWDEGWLRFASFEKRRLILWNKDVLPSVDRGVYHVCNQKDRTLLMTPCSGTGYYNSLEEAEAAFAVLEEELLAGRLH